MFKIKANTPEETRQAIVEWLKKESIMYGSQSRTARLKKSKFMYENYSSLANVASNAIASAKIEPKS